MHRLIPVLLLCLLSPLANATKVTVGVNHSPPYRILDDGEARGFYIDVFNALADQLGWEIEYQAVPFRRVLWMLESGEADIMLGALPTEKRIGYLDFSIAAFPPEPKHFFYVHPENRITRYADLKGKVIEVLRGSTYNADFDKDPSLIREPGISYPMLMRMLEAGRLDVVVAPELVGRHSAATVSDRLRVSPFTLSGQTSYIAISRKSPVMAHRDDLQAALARLRDNGTFDRIQRRYTSEE
nr:transporter substrate-binding domain-containing protein [Marinobacter bryozoorum]